MPTRTHLGRALQALVDKCGIKKTDVARKAGVHNSLVTRVISNITPHPTPANVAKLASAFPRRLDKAQLLAAYAVDQCQGPGSDLVVVSVKGTSTPNWSASKPVTAGELARRLANNK